MNPTAGARDAPAVNGSMLDYKIKEASEYLATGEGAVAVMLYDNVLLGAG